MSTQLIKGPAIVSFAGQNIFTSSPIKLEMVPKSFNIETDAYGTVDTRLDDTSYKVSFTPSGRWTEIGPLLSAMGTLMPGQPLFGESDNALVITPLLPGQQVVTLPRAAMTKLPTLTAAATKTMWGAVEFTAIRARDATGFDDAESLIAFSAWSAPSEDFEVDEVIAGHWTAIWDENPDAPESGNPWVDFDTLDGWAVDFNLETSEDITDKFGLVGVTVKQVGVTAKCTPAGITEEELQESLRHQGTVNGAAVLRGQSMRWKPVTRKLRLRHTTPYGDVFDLNIGSAALSGGSIVYGAAENRIGEVTFMGLRPFGPSPMAQLYENLFA